MPVTTVPATTASTASTTTAADVSTFLRADVRCRTLHLVDLENLLGGSAADDGEVARALDAYLLASRWRAGDLVCLAAAPALALAAARVRPVEWSLHSAVGPDAADLVLLANARAEFVERRAGRMVVGSGDHIFVDCARAARARGVLVEVVARHRTAHHTWWRHGFPVVELRDAPARAA